MSPPTHWHLLPSDQVLADLGTSSDGLSAEEAVRRLGESGPNELPGAHAVSPWAVLGAQFQNVLILILLVAAALSASLGEVLEAVVIAVIVLFAILLGFVQEYRAERAMEALRRMAAPTARVVRGGRELRVPSRELVPGDLVRLAAGDRIPADLRLIEAVNLKVNEAALTGESNAVGKTSVPLADPDLGVGDRVNLAYSGTDVTYGRGQGVVVATGLHTEFGQVTGLLAGIETQRTPLQQNLDRVGRVLAIAAVMVVVLIAGLGVWRGEPLLEMFIFGVALAVAVVPEALPAVVTISLAIGVQRMVRRHALIRHLPTVETLGSTSVICSDKTGTLTRDEMTVREVWIDGCVCTLAGSGYEPSGAITRSEDGPAQRALLDHLLRAAALCNDARLEREEGAWHLRGDPTEGALVVAAAKADLDLGALEAQAPRVEEIPFSPERRRMTTLHQTADGVMAFSKGAPELILGTCSHQATATGVQVLDEAARLRIVAAARDMACRALRVLAIAYKPQATLLEAEQGMIFTGLVGMMDPPRTEARAAIAECERAGIRPVMITGDHPDTAEAIARELGILRDGRVVVGRDLDVLSQADLERQVEQIQVYARVSPEHKLRVVTAWQARGHICAMTGDGVNDAPALKRADIGVAMGIAGTDVSREAADMTLTDDNFASIVGAVEEGRGIFSNIKKYLMYLAVLEHRRDRPHGGGDPSRDAAAPVGGADPLRQPRHRRPAGPGPGLRPPGAGPDASPAPGPQGGDLHQARGGPDAGRGPLVDPGQHWTVRLGAAPGRGPGARPRAGPDPRHDHDLPVPGSDSVLQGVQLSLGPDLGPGPPLRQPLAQPGHPLGADPVAGRDLCTGARRRLRDLSPRGRGLGDRRCGGLQRGAGAGAGQVADPAADTGDRGRWRAGLDLRCVTCRHRLARCHGTDSGLPLMLVDRRPCALSVPLGPGLPVTRMA